MVKPYGKATKTVDLEEVGTGYVVCVRGADYGRFAAHRVSGDWTNGELAVYLRVGEEPWYDTGERITAGDPRTDLIDLAGWSEARVATVVAETGGSGLEVRPVWGLVPAA